MSYSLCLPAWSIGEDCYKEIYKYARPYGTKVVVNAKNVTMDGKPIPSLPGKAPAW